MSEPPSALQASTLPAAISEQPDVLRGSIAPQAGSAVESTPLGSITEDKAVIPPTWGGSSGSGFHTGVAGAGDAAGPSGSVSDPSITTPRAHTTANTTSDTTDAAAPPHLSEHEPLATELKPITAATLTVRIIKSFEFRTQKSLVLKEVDLEKITVGELMERCRKGECGVAECLDVSESCAVSTSGVELAAWKFGEARLRSLGSVWRGGAAGRGGKRGGSDWESGRALGAPKQRGKRLWREHRVVSAGRQDAGHRRESAGSA